MNTELIEAMRQLMEEMLKQEVNQLPGWHRLKDAIARIEAES